MRNSFSSKMRAAMARVSFSALAGNILLSSFVSVLPTFAPVAAAIAPSCTVTLNAGDDIQTAINNATAGDVICMNPGIYPVSLALNVNKAVTLMRTGCDLGLVAPHTIGNAATEAILDGGNTVNRIMTISANDAKVACLEMRNVATNFIVTTGGVSGIQIINNVIHGIDTANVSSDGAIYLTTTSNALVKYNHMYNTRGYAVAFEGGTGTQIRDNKIHDMTVGNGAIYGFTLPTNTTIDGNLVYGISGNDSIKLGRSGNVADNTSSNGGSITNNIVTGGDQDGLSVYMGGLTVSGNKVKGTASDQGAIYVAFNSPNITVSNNLVTGNGRGIRVGTLPTNLAVNNNCIVGNSVFGMQVSNASAIVNAENNWWGAATGPNTVGADTLIGGNIANVDTNPFTTTGCNIAAIVDGNLDTIPDGSDDPLADVDSDGVADGSDNCPLVSNVDQLDSDGDLIGNACDGDNDNDTILDIVDNCPLVANADQLNNDLDSEGDVCDADDDNDGITDAFPDNCQFISNVDQLDSDGDLSGNACDGDNDNDGVLDIVDNCDFVANPGQENTYGGPDGDACEALVVVCGDGLVQGGEACDDGDTDSNDGCSATCTVESGYQCSGGPSVCVQTCNGLVPTITGAGNIFGTLGSDVIMGSSGNDTIVGLTGNDTICGAGGDDTINGGIGNDWVSGGDGNDTILGGINNDDLYGDEGHDTILGELGNDDHFGGNGTDYCGDILGSNTFNSCEANGLNGVVIIKKDAVPNDAQDFDFTGDLAAFSLDDDADGTLSNEYAVVKSTGLFGNSYTVTETPASGWDLTNITCVDPLGNSTTNLGAGSATINLSAAEVVTCTFTNTQVAPAVCGNGAIELGEVCDDGNVLDGDGCSSICQNQLLTCTPTDTDLSFYIPFDEFSGPTAFDKTANNIDGTHMNGVAVVAGGPTLASYYNTNHVHFDGTDDYVDFGNAGFATPSSFSVSAWVNPDAVAIDQQIISKGYNGTQTEWELKTTTADGKVSFQTYNAGQIGAVSSTALTNGVWTHLVGTYDGSTWKIYQDGVLTGSAAGAAPIATAQPIFVGAVSNQGTPVQFWDGGIDDVRFYDRALTLSEVGELYAGDCDATAPVASICGNTIIEAGEQCDDGNVLNGDGCSDTCQNQALACVSTDTGLVANWKFDETAGAVATDSTTYDNVGAINGATLAQTAAPATTFYNPGSFGFDGVNDTVLVTDVTDIPTGNEARTVAFWANQNSISHQGVYVSLGNGATADQKFIVMMGDEPHPGQAYLFTDGINGANNVPVSGAEIPTAGWHHIAFSYDGAGNWGYYIDGSLTKSGVFPVAINTVTNAVEIGARNDAVSGSFDGLLDDVRIYDRALNATEIGDLVAGDCDTAPVGPLACVPTDTNLAAYWKLDELAGVTADDSSTNANDGTLTGGVTQTGATASLTFANTAALSFDGADDVVTVGDVASLDFDSGNKFSASMWVYADSFSGYQTLIHKIDDTGAPRNGYLFTLNNGIPEVFLINDFTLGNYINATSIAPLSTGAWHHVAFSYDGSSTAAGIKIYVDGGNVTGAAIVDALSGPMANNQPFEIGRRNTAGIQAFAGRLDDIRVYSDALGTTQIAELFGGQCNAGAFVIVPPPVVDTDNDTIPDATDNCPLDSNIDQLDVDNDNIGDICDPVNNNLSQTLFFEPEDSNGNNQGNSSHRGHETNRFLTQASFLAGLFGGNSNNFFGGLVPPGAFGGGNIPGGGFGGGPDVPFSQSETDYICSMQNGLPRTHTDSFVEWLGTYMATLMGRDADQVLAALKDPDFCKPAEQAAVHTPDETRNVHVNKQGIVVSSNPVWNACVSGKDLTLSLIKSNTDKVVHRQRNIVKEFAMTCRDYHRGEASLWTHPDYPGLEIELDAKGRLVGGVPSGYTIVQDGGTNVVQK